MPILDLTTVFIVNILLNLMMCIVMVTFWRTQKTYPGFGYWVACEVVITIIYPLLLLRGIIPDLFSIVLMNVLSIWATTLRCEGILRFFEIGRMGNFFRAFPAFFFPLFAYFLYVDNNMMVRAALNTVGMALYLVPAIWLLLFRPGRIMRGINWAIAALLLVWILILAVRIIFWFLDPAVRGIFNPAPVNIAFFVALPVHDLGITILFLILNGHRLTEELRDAQNELEALAATDSLTGIYNRRKLLKEGEEEFDRARRYQYPLALALLDLDHFKRVNDTFGHDAGDMVLKNFVSAARSELRHIDVMGRLGGEEFVVLLPYSTLALAQEIAERLRRTVAWQEIRYDSRTIPLTVSIGVTVQRPEDQSILDLLGRADKALYAAKDAGRNRVQTDIEFEAAAAYPPKIN